MKYNGNNLEEVLADHKIWLKSGKIKSEEAHRADFSYANLTDMTLINMDLTGAIFKHADLHNAFLCNSIFTGADFEKADLSYANFRNAEINLARFDRANLMTADFSYTSGKYTSFAFSNLFGNNFSKALLDYADFTHADASYANFRHTILDEATFDNTKLAEADFTSAVLYKCKFMHTTEGLLNMANFKYAKIQCDNVQHILYDTIPIACPSEGSFIGWKKALAKIDGELANVIVKLLIPSEALRLSSTSSKCRASKAVVLDIQMPSGKSIDVAAFSTHDATFTYKKGQTVVPKEIFDHDRFNECSSGIHFFVDRNEAVHYY